MHERTLLRSAQHENQIMEAPGAEPAGASMGHARGAAAERMHSISSQSCECCRRDVCAELFRRQPAMSLPIPQELPDSQQSCSTQQHTCLVVTSGGKDGHPRQQGWPASQPHMCGAHGGHTIRLAREHCQGSVPRHGQQAGAVRRELQLRDGQGVRCQAADHSPAGYAP